MTVSGGLQALCRKNKLCVGDSAELLSPGKTGRRFTVRNMFDENGQPIDSCPRPFMKFYIEMPFEAAPGDILRA